MALKWTKIEEVMLEIAVKEGLTYREIGELLGRSKYAVTKHAQRMRDRAEVIEATKMREEIKLRYILFTINKK